MPRQRRRVERSEFKIVIDTREQRPFSFAGFRGKSGRLIVPRVARNALKSGDYSIVGLEDQVAIERKSLPDLYGVVGSNRERFTRELERLQQFSFSAIVVESDERDIHFAPPPYTSLTPSTVMNSLAAWEINYGVHVRTCMSRESAEQVTFSLLRFFWKKSRNAT